MIYWPLWCSFLSFNLFIMVTIISFVSSFVIIYFFLSIVISDGHLCLLMALVMVVSFFWFDLFGDVRWICCLRRWLFPNDGCLLFSNVLPIKWRSFFLLIWFSWWWLFKNKIYCPWWWSFLGDDHLFLLGHVAFNDGHLLLMMC